MKTRNRTTIIFALTVAGVLYVATHALLKSSRLHINFSSSVPIGLYRETTDQQGSYAGICLPTDTVLRAIHAGLSIDSGICPGGFEPILKPIFEATTANPVVFGEKGFAVAGRFIPNTAPKSQSRTGATLAHIPFGSYQSGLWAISGFNASSFDSRYFGPVNPGSIQFHAQPFLTF